MPKKGRGLRRKVLLRGPSGWRKRLMRQLRKIRRAA